MKCFVYRSERRADTYLYLPRADDFSTVPEALMRVFGKASLALEFELTPARKLAQAEPRQVMESLREQGFYLQMPPANETLI
ncbi:YcgL domain-containing protein [Acidihalobacter ferrooxydans]|uniref:YcgL domain-containing protein BW247_15695 n=1 Tax=Acidihalobacter ferrooxydans TaxID=1765967 RepID=A0A1P8UKI3_9GAMM|nr:YcgL domain-containing protein [Acidihalobacter ferrooxydans]APZ44351.1 hypothetical protein BW247_15695 [Acidihalobacter ferrooxydans]